MSSRRHKSVQLCCRYRQVSLHIYIYIRVIPDCLWITTWSAYGLLREVLMDYYVKCIWITTSSAYGLLRQVLMDYYVGLFISMLVTNKNIPDIARVCCVWYCVCCLVIYLAILLNSMKYVFSGVDYIMVLNALKSWPSCAYVTGLSLLYHWNLNTDVNQTCLRYDNKLDLNLNLAESVDFIINPWQYALYRRNLYPSISSTSQHHFF